MRHPHCLMLNDNESWRMYGLDAIEQVNNKRSARQEFIELLYSINSIGILNAKISDDIVEHLSCLEKDPDQGLVDILEIYSNEDNRQFYVSYVICPELEIEFL